MVSPVMCPLQQYLRGRMGHSFYHSMGFLDLIAHSADDYVAISVRLGVDTQYRQRCTHIIKRLGHVIWNRAEVVAEWELFLLTSLSYAVDVRRAKRDDLETIKRRDAEYLDRLHREVSVELASLEYGLEPAHRPYRALPLQDVASTECTYQCVLLL